MMIKEWNWNHFSEDFWEEPADELYHILSRWKQNRYLKILDLGCGIGRNSIFFAQHGFRVSACDLSQSGITILKEKIKDSSLQIEPKIGDMLSLPYKSGDFDGVIGFHSIYHTDYKGLKQVIREIHRVLKNDGEVYLTFNSKTNSSYSDSSNEIIDANTIIKTHGIEKGIPHTYLDYEEIIRFLERFRIIKVQHIQDFFSNETSWHYFVLCSKT
jgi:2-polyprenyl-3-methyl-5-hydroxy-6-metoxy-1,4-benzoquinol methylase